MTQIEIRPTTPADLDNLADVLVAVHVKDGYPVEGVDNPRAWLDLPNPVGQWTALFEGRPAGHVAIVNIDPTEPGPSMAINTTGVDADRMAALVRLFVAPYARGRQMASHLVAEAEATARARGLTLTLDVMAKDVAAIELYRARGWRRLGTFVHQGGSTPVTALTFVHPTTMTATQPPI